MLGWAFSGLCADKRHVCLMFISMEFAQFAQTMSSSSRYWLVISCNIHHLNWVSIFIQYIHIYRRYAACNVQRIRCIYKTVYCIIVTIILQTSQTSVQSKRLKIFHQSLTVRLHIENSLVVCTWGQK